MKTRLKLEQLMARLSSDFINLPLEEMDHMISNTLKDIAKFAQAIRSSLFLFSEDLQTVTNTHEWCENPETSQIALLQNIPSDTFGYYWELLQQKKNVVMSFKTDLSPEAEGEWEWIREHGWQSLLFVPMVFEGKLYGALGFYGEIGEERQWFDDLVPFLQFVATILTNTFERKKADKALHESEIKYRNLFHKSNDAIFLSEITDDGKIGNFIEVNDVSCQRLGYSRAKLLTMSPGDIIDKEMHHKIPIAMHNFLTQGNNTIELIHVSKSGRKIPVEINSQLITLEGKKWVLAAARDITERKLAEEALHESEEKWRSLVSNTPDVIVNLDRNGTILFINHTVPGFTVEETIGKTVYDFIPQEQHEITLKSIETVFKTGESVNFETSMIGSDGNLLWYSTRLGPIKKCEKIISVAQISTDITERKQAEEKINHLNLVLRSIRDINQLKVKEYNRETLLKGICKSLIENRGYSHAWIAIWDNSGKFVLGTEAGLDKKFSPLIRKMERNDWPTCVQNALKQSNILIVDNPSDTCRNCPLSTQYLENSSMVIRLEHEGKIYGLLSVSSPLKFAEDEEEQVLFTELTHDIAFALHSLEIGEERINARKSLKEKDVLLQEIHHRVKNNLQVISSLLSLQSEHIEDKQTLEMFQKSQDRIKSIALIHEKLYSESEDLTRINFASYVHDLATKLFSSYEISLDIIKLNIDVIDILLDITLAIPCGLIINELVSNSLKHAFPDNREGEINIMLRKSNENEFTLILGDNGVGLPLDIDFPNIETLGLQLVFALVKQLEGTMELDRSDGTVFKIQFVKAKDIGP